MMLLRSMLFTPGNNMRMISKVGTLGADAIILDLEDAVPMTDKETARLFVRDSLQYVSRHGSLVFVRINALDTGLSEDDLDWVVQSGLNGIVLPKAVCADDVQTVSRWLEKLEHQRKLPANSLTLIPIMETAKGLMNVYSIAGASPRVVALALGGVDLSRDMGIKLTKEGAELLYPRTLIAIAARAAGILSIDTPCISVNDRNQLKMDAHAARQLGFRGKLLIHPSQVTAVNEIFSPAADDIAEARKIVEAFDKSQEQGLGAISLHGKMIDVANYQQAKDLLAFTEAIESRCPESKG